MIALKKQFLICLPIILFLLITSSHALAASKAISSSHVTPEKPLNTLFQSVKNFYVEVETGASVSTNNITFKPDNSSPYETWYTPESGWPHTNMGTRPLYGIIFGYRLNSTISFDIDYLYRSNFKWATEATYDLADMITDRKKTIYGISAQTLMFNTRLAAGEWNHLTPYVSFGVGAAFNKTEGLRNIEPVDNDLINTLDGSRTNNFSWQVGLGLYYGFTPNWNIDFAYHLRDIGPLETGHNKKCYHSVIGNSLAQPFVTDRVYLNEVSVGIRYQF